MIDLSLIELLKHPWPENNDFGRGYNHLRELIIQKTAKVEHIAGTRIKNEYMGDASTRKDEERTVELERGITSPASDQQREISYSKPWLDYVEKCAKLDDWHMSIVGSDIWMLCDLIRQYQQRTENGTGAQETEAVRSGIEQPVGLTIADYEQTLADHRQLVREIDVILNGEDGAAKQASLCDLMGDIKRHKACLDEYEALEFEKEELESENEILIQRIAKIENVNEGGIEMSNRLDPTIKENWQYHDEYEFWYMPYPGTNETQGEEGVRWRGFRPWENARAPERESGWIRVQDALPVDNQDVLMGWADGASAGVVRQGKYFDNESILHGFAEKKDTHYVGKIGITHWMPLPKLYEIEGGK